MFKFLHAADIHLDSPLRGLARYEGAPVERIRLATREALQALIQTAIDEQVAFVVIAGDVFDGDWKDYNTGLFFAGQMSRLRREGIRVFMIAGNHDAASLITKTLRMPDNVTLFSSSRPESVTLEDIGVALHGQGFSRREVTENLAAGYPAATPGLYNIGLLHTCADGRAGHDPYAPCKKDDLISKHYDYWALGHVHSREILHEHPWIIFPGNIQGRHIRETGPKGCTLVFVDPDSTTRVEHRDLDLVRWAHLTLDCTGAETGDEILGSLRPRLLSEVKGADGRMLALRLVIKGDCPAHSVLSANAEKWINEIRAAAADIGDGSIWIENVRFLTDNPLDMTTLLQGNTPAGDLLELIEEMTADDAQLTELSEMLSSFKSKLPFELFEEEDGLDLTSSRHMRELVTNAKKLLLPCLFSKRAG